jgi:hypothetical protein
LDDYCVLSKRGDPAVIRRHRRSKRFCPSWCATCTRPLSHARLHSRNAGTCQALPHDPVPARRNAHVCTACPPHRRGAGPLLVHCARAAAIGSAASGLVRASVMPPAGRPPPAVWLCAVCRAVDRSGGGVGVSGSDLRGSIQPRTHTRACMGWDIRARPRMSST